MCITNYEAPQTKKQLKVVYDSERYDMGYTIRIAKLKTVHFQRNYKRSIHRDHCNCVQKITEPRATSRTRSMCLFSALSILYAFGAEYVFFSLVHWNSQENKLQAIIYRSVIHVDTKTRF